MNMKSSRCDLPNSIPAAGWELGRWELHKQTNLTVVRNPNFGASELNWVDRIYYMKSV